MKNKYLILCAMTVIVSLACVAIAFRGKSPQFEPESLPAAQVGADYEAEIRVTENDTPIGDFYISNGVLPPGLELIWEEHADTAKISGVPTEAGTFTFTVSIWCLGTNVSGEQGEKEYEIVVAE
jgi:hypothetical protein